MITRITVSVSSIFPDHINTDDIIPGWTLQESVEKDFFGKHAFSNYDPEFVKRSKKHKSGLLIAGENFGSGSSREQAIYALQENNIQAVIAKSFPDIFYRNSLNNGLILIRFEEISMFEIGDEVEIDLDEKKIIHKEKEHEFFMRETDKDIFSAGGKTSLVKDFLKNQIEGKVKKLKHYSKVKSKKSKSQTIVEKIISSHLHKKVFAGENLENIPVDVLFVNDAFGPAVIKEFQDSFTDVFNSNNGKLKVFDPKKIFFIADHDAPPSTIKSADGIELMKQFCKKHEIKFYKAGDGIEHVVLMEDGHIVPGSIVLGTDSHTCTNGAFNSLAFGIGTTEAAYALSTGYLHHFSIPDTIRVNLHGKFLKGVYAKDLVLYLIGLLGVHGAVGKVIEFGGSALNHLSLESRSTIANMAVEMGARSAIFEFDKSLENFLKDKAQFPYKPFKPDRRCSYSKEIELNLRNLEPCVAFPHKPDNVTFISKISDYMQESREKSSVGFPAINSLQITNAFLGACTNGKYEDFIEAGKILKDKKISEEVDFVAIPASRKIYNKLLKEGILKIIANAGANIESSTCGPCYGKHKGLLFEGGQMISSSNRNYLGRMGSKGGKIFLASPATVVASAVAGKIVDPREYL